MKAVPIHLAKAKLSQLIEWVLAGESVIIARGKKPVVRLVAIDQPVGRKFGAMRGKAIVGNKFFEPLPDNELHAWDN